MFGIIELREESLRRIDRLVVGDAWVAELLASLPADQRQAVRARVLEDRSYEEIAAALATSPLVVRKRVSRGLARLRTELERRP
jgi:RNA polymerase sigma-70 factor (ECF subfamily)